MPALPGRLIRVIRTTDAWAIIGLIAFPLVYYFPVTLGQKVFSEGDLLWLFLPIRTELTHALVAGHLPLWTRGIQAGFPLFAEDQVAALYPLNLILHRFLPVPTAISFAILFSFIWASVGMYLLIRSCGLRAPSAFLAGLVFSASGFLLAHLSHVSLCAVASWLPWLVLFQQKYWQAVGAKRKALHWFLLDCFSIACLLLGGFPHMAFLVLILFTLFGVLGPLLWGLEANASRRDKVAMVRQWLPRSVFITATTVLLGMGLAAVQLLPTTEFLSLSARAQETGKSFFTSYSLEPLALTQFPFPFWYLGQPSADNMEFWGYLGVLPLALAILAPILRRDVRTCILFSFAGLALVLALGGNTPLYEWLYYIPVFNRFRAPARFLVLFVFLAAFLAATAFDDLQNRLANPPGTTGFAWINPIVMSALFGGIVLLGYNQPSEFWIAAWRFLPIILILLCALVLGATQWHRLTRNAWSVLVIGITALDLALFAAPFLTNLARMSPAAELIQPPRTVQAMDNQQKNYRVFVNRFPAVTQASIRATLWRFLPLVFGKEGIVTGYIPGLALERNEEYIRNMSLEMRNLINLRYYLLPLETLPPGAPSPFDEDEPNGGLTLSVLANQPQIPPTRVTQVEMTSYVDQARDLPNGFLAGELLLGLADGESQTLPIRVGIETADWAYDGLALGAQPHHSKPALALAFPAYLSSIGREFEGHKYVARYDIAGGAGATVTSIGVRAFLPDAQLTIEQIVLNDGAGHSVSLSSLLGRNDLSLVFRSHTAAMWDNRDVLPRAFIVHQAEIVPDDQTLVRLQAPDFHPEQVALLSDGKSLNQSGETPSDQVVIEEYESERVVIRATTDERGYLVLTDSWYPGWNGWVDGQSVLIQRADYIFRAVLIEPGEHRIVFEYQPQSFALGVWISGISVLIVMFLGWLGLR